MNNYTLKDHGTWVPYTPDPLPDWHSQVVAMGQITMFLKRESDGVDWYEYRNTPNRFGENSIVFNTLHYPNKDEEIVKAVFRDFTMIFPQNQRLVEVIGIDPSVEKVHKLFTEMVYDPKTQTLSGEPGAKFPIKTIKKDLWLRATDDEADKIEAWLTTQTARQQRLFNDTMTFDHADQIYTDLIAAFTTLFGKDRAEALLAMSK